MPPLPPLPRGVKWSNWHRKQDLFIRPIRSTSSSVPAGRPAVLRARCTSRRSRTCAYTWSRARYTYTLRSRLKLTFMDFRCCCVPSLFVFFPPFSVHFVLFRFFSPLYFCWFYPLPYTLIIPSSQSQLPIPRPTLCAKSLSLEKINRP